METITVQNRPIRVLRFDALVIGTGCAGYNAADSLHALGVTHIAILTEGVNMGTSRNTGSDKQTYYKLSLCSDSADSVYELAQNLFSGGSVNGDTALAEAAGSVRAFMKLVSLGVPFPTNAFGEYVGYKTDHDPKQRATSCGPLTSKRMTECLEQSVLSKGIPIFDGMQAVKLLTAEGRVLGVLAIDQPRLSPSDWGLTLFLAPRVIMATGGPAILYENSVYPESQTGMTGMALEAGAVGCNLQEWQYGLASTAFRWNVSGTYQQVLPRYIAVDKEGNEREFLPDYFPTPAAALDCVFLKGYQWPFDAAKVPGSSLIDLIVHHEIFHKGCRVYLDYTQNPKGLEQGFSSLSPEAYGYLERSGALFGAPIDRLRHMNPQAIRLYASHGISLEREPLEISVCAQHNNGGLDVDCHWQTSLSGLYVAGEAAGTFGVTRPGGSALNSTQAGSFRAAEHISLAPPAAPPKVEEALPQLEEFLKSLSLLWASGEAQSLPLRRKVQHQMSEAAAHVRSPEKLRPLLTLCEEEYHHFFEHTRLSSPAELPQALKTRDMLCTACAVLSAMLCSASRCGSRGSALVLSPTGTPAHDKLPDYTFFPEDRSYRAFCLLSHLEAGRFVSRFHPVRPLPKTEDWFETVLQEYNRLHGIE